MPFFSTHIALGRTRSAMAVGRGGVHVGDDEELVGELAAGVDEQRGCWASTAPGLVTCTQRV
jgi:hypothetical protein